MATQDFKGSLNGMYGATHPAFLVYPATRQADIATGGVTVVWGAP
jgi:hypothetical protein